MKTRKELFEAFNQQRDEWPNDGSDWDGMSTPTLEKILEHQEIVKRLKRYEWCYPYRYDEHHKEILEILGED